jgi:hypothetical protein
MYADPSGQNLIARCAKSDIFYLNRKFDVKGSRIGRDPVKNSQLIDLVVTQKLLAS